MGDLLRRAVSWINGELDPRFVLVTGDVGENDLKEELESAREILDGLRVPYRVLCGNHDGVEEGNFQQVFGERLFRIDTETARFLCMGTGAGLYGDIGDREIEWLEEELAKSEIGPCVLVTHHALTEQGDGHLMVLAERGRVLEVLRRSCRVPLVLSGHEHAFSLSRQGDTWFVIAPPFVVEPHQFLSYELSPTMVRVQVYEYEPDQDSFISVESFSLSLEGEQGKTY